MLDRHINKFIAKPLEKLALEFAKLGIAADQVTMIGFVLGVIAFLEIIYGNYTLGLVFILLNRLADGIDGKLATIKRPTNAGGFLDIVLDFIFYSLIPLGFAFSNPHNTTAALVLLFSFMATGSSFLAFSIMAEKHQINNTDYPNKSIYYLGGITEGSETVIFFILICLLPSFFAPLAYIFVALCLVTAGYRIIHGFNTLKEMEKK